MASPAALQEQRGDSQVLWEHRPRGGEAAAARDQTLGSRNCALMGEAWGVAPPAAGAAGGEAETPVGLGSGWNIPEAVRGAGFLCGAWAWILNPVRLPLSHGALREFSLLGMLF